MSRPKPGPRPVRRALRIIAHEPERKSPAVRGRGQDLVHDTIREEADHTITGRRYVDAFSAVAIHINPKRATIVPTYVDIEFQAST